jgi:hypothetical protein
MIHNIGYQTHMFYTTKIITLNAKGLQILYLALSLGIVLIVASCNKNDREIPKSLQEYLKNQGIQETIIDLDYSTLDIPDKRYVSLTVTYNFSTSDGTPQKELLGFILKLDDNIWKIDRGATHTKSEKKAKELLLGGKK